MATRIRVQGPTHHDPISLEAGIQEFLKHHLLIENLRRFLSADEDDLLRAIQALTPEEQGSFADKLDHVCPSNVCRLFSPTLIRPQRHVRPSTNRTPSS